MTETEAPLNCMAQREDCLDGLSSVSHVQQTYNCDCVFDAGEVFAIEAFRDVLN